MRSFSAIARIASLDAPARRVYAHPSPAFAVWLQRDLGRLARAIASVSISAATLASADPRIDSTLPQPERRSVLAQLQAQVQTQSPPPTRPQAAPAPGSGPNTASAQPATQGSAVDVPRAPRGAATGNAALAAPADRVASAPASKVVAVLLLPLDQALLRRAALAVRDGVRSVASRAGNIIELRECGYGNDAVVAAYQRCVTSDVSVVIGPLGRSEVTQLLSAPVEALHPTATANTRVTLMLSPSGSTPPASFFVLAPDLESEAERIAKQALEDACVKPMIVDAGGPLASRIAVAMTGHFRASGAATQLRQTELGSRERWTRMTEGWRKDGVDCVLFAGNGAQLSEFRPFLRSIVVYATSASFESELDRTVDWTGVRIADSPFVLEPTRSDFAPFAPAEPLAPTLARLFALGLDAARMSFDAALLGKLAPDAERIRLAETVTSDAKPSIEMPLSFDGAIGRLSLQNGQYLRTPAIGEFRGRNPQPLGF